MNKICCGCKNRRTQYISQVKRPDTRSLIYRAYDAYKEAYNHA